MGTRQSQASFVDELVTAPLWRRLLASSLDLSVALAVLFVLVTLRVLWVVPAFADDLDIDPWGRALAAQLAFVVLHVILQASFVRWSVGQTPAGERLGIRVVRFDGGPVGLARALMRPAIPAACLLAPRVWPGLVLMAACGLPAAFGARRSLADIVVGTRVIRFDRDEYERDQVSAANQAGDRADDQTYDRTQQRTAARATSARWR